MQATTFILAWCSTFCVLARTPMCVMYTVYVFELSLLPIVMIVLSNCSSLSLSLPFDFNAYKKLNMHLSSAWNNTCDLISYHIFVA